MHCGFDADTPMQLDPHLSGWPPGRERGAVTKQLGDRAFGTNLFVADAVPKTVRSGKCLARADDLPKAPKPKVSKCLARTEG